MEIHRKIPINPKKVQKELHKSQKKTKTLHKSHNSGFFIWLVVEPYPSEKSWSESQLGWWHSQYMESHKSHVPNHQPVIINHY